jgi:ElaB/YqjD/DUF883 family membrane-anchored ribosome-binding protein
MAYDDDQKSSAELQREIEMQRNRVEDTIDQIQEKLSPGQLVDELLAYTKGGGGEFVASLQRNVTANPLPVALLGVSLAWLMAKPGQGGAASGYSRNERSDRAWDESINRNRGYGVDDDDDDFDEYEDYPVTIISGGSMQRLGSVRDEHGRSFSEFSDDAGRKFRARSDATGRRAGHFMDEAGNRYKGFTNAAGEQVKHFRDEAGNLLDDATGWAAENWQKAREKLHDARDAISSGADMGKARASQASDAMMHQVDSLNRTIMHQFRDQPLVGGALAFALGAAMGAALPRTEQEDALMGEAADAVKERVGETASELYEQGRDKAAELYATASEKTGEIYQQAKEGLVGDNNPGTGSTGGSSTI